jgi:hypothetical protein
MASPAQPSPKDYAYNGPFDPARFEAEYKKRFASVPKYNAVSIPDLQTLLAKIVADTRIKDVRWAAYMLATAFIESSHTIKVAKQTKNPRGKLQTHTIKVWRNFTPIAEAGFGKGRAYQDPVKVLRVGNGARVTERDGDQWDVSATGVARPVSKPAGTRGVTPGTPKSAVYVQAGGDEQLYYGRGYVQLTWWNTYATAGVCLGRGLEFLFNPEHTNAPDVAYAILAEGMLTGRIYANGRKFTDYFDQTKTDYLHARNMVNPGAKVAEKQTVAGYAESFEAALLASKPAVQVAIP